MRKTKYHFNLLQGKTGDKKIVPLGVGKKWSDKRALRDSMNSALSAYEDGSFKMGSRYALPDIKIMANGVII